MQKLTFYKRNYPTVLLVIVSIDLSVLVSALFLHPPESGRWPFWCWRISCYPFPSRESFPDESDNLGPQDLAFPMVLFLPPLEDIFAVHQTDPTEKSERVERTVIF